MNQKYTDEQRQFIIEQFTHGHFVAILVDTTGIPRSTIYAWLNAVNEKNCKKEVSLRSYRNLESKVKRLEGIIEILQTVNCRMNDPLKVKLDALEELYGKYSVHMLCDALKVSRGTFYNHILRNKRDNSWYSKQREIHRVRIQQIYDDNHQIFGAAKNCSYYERRWLPHFG